MGQLMSSEQVSQVKRAIGVRLYEAMSQGGAVPDLGVVHPFLLANHSESSDCQARLQEHLQQLQDHVGNKAPTYLKDLINRLTTFSDEPRLAGLVGLVVTMVIDLAYTSSKSRAGRSSGSSSCQRMWELQEAVEEYLKRCRINLSHRSKLIQDCVRLEAQVSLTLTQLKTCLLGGDCDSRSLRHWASGAAFHTQMLVHLAGLEGHVEPLAARAAIEQYKEDLAQMIPAYRRFKSNTVCVVKCRGGPMASCGPSSEVPEEGAMTGLTVTDRETGQSVTVSLSSLEMEIERNNTSGPDDGSATASFFPNLDLVTSDQFLQAYLEHLFSDQGPVAELENYFTKTRDYMRTLILKPRSKNETSGKNAAEPAVGGDKDVMESNQRDESLKLSVVETQPEENLNHSLHYEPEQLDCSHVD